MSERRARPCSVSSACDGCPEGPRCAWQQTGHSMTAPALARAVIEGEQREAALRELIERAQGAYQRMCQGSPEFCEGCRVGSILAGEAEPEGSGEGQG